MKERLSVTQEEILATMRAHGAPIAFHAVLEDLRLRVKAESAHRQTLTKLNDVLEEWGDLERRGRIRREMAGSTLWERVPRAEIIDDDKTSEES